MTVKELTELLEANYQFAIRIMLPSGQFIPNYFHITEVGRINKHFLDCGRIWLTSASCLLQAWTANDTDHHLTAGRMAKIIKIAEPILESDDARFSK